MAANDWLVWALLSAVFASLTAIFAKVGLGGIDADFATLVRTVVILLVLAVFVVAAGKWRDPRTLSAKAVGFLVLSALATGASWVCYFRALKVGDAAKVAPVDKLSVVLVAIFATVFLHERPSLTAWMGIGLVGVGVAILSLSR
jgi:transporter family protein